MPQGRGTFGIPGGTVRLLQTAFRHLSHDFIASVQLFCHVGAFPFSCDSEVLNFKCIQKMINRRSGFIQVPVGKTSLAEVYFFVSCQKFLAEFPTAWSSGVANLHLIWQQNHSAIQVEKCSLWLQCY
jgi:hypothetical protein